MDGSMREMRYNFYSMRRELASSLTLCKVSSDQYHRVMHSITAILYNAVEAMQDRKQFKASHALVTAFALMDNLTEPIQEHDMLFFKFARSFVLFMDSMNGFCTVSKIAETVDTSRNADRPIYRQVPKSSSSSNQVKRPRLCPVLKDGTLITSPLQRPIVDKSVYQKRTALCPSAIPLTKPLDEIKKEDEMDVAEGHLRGTGRCANGETSVMQNVPSTSNGIIKEEEATQESTSSGTATSFDSRGRIHPQHTITKMRTAYAAGSSKTPQLLKRKLDDAHSSMDHANNVQPPFNSEKEIKEEVNEDIKVEEMEEPIEKPIADKITISSTARPSTSRTKPIVNCNTLGELEPKKELCRLCFRMVATESMVLHMKISHRANWLRMARKCPDADCDFFCLDDPSIEKHCQIVHSDTFQKWKYTNRFKFPNQTLCPYCPLQMSSIKQFIEHMERSHTALFGDEAQILTCVSCKYSAAHFYQMYTHWLQRGDKRCNLGVKFNQSVARAAKAREIKRVMECRHARK